MRDLSVHRESLESRAAYELISALNAELSHRYPEPGPNHFQLDAHEVAPGNGAFIIARVDKTPVGCGAVRRLDANTAEIKRMYVVPNRRRLGIGRELLKRLESIAHELGAQRLVLATGVRQPEAIALYRRDGFVEISPFGEYVDSPSSCCMGKTLPLRQPRISP